MSFSLELPAAQSSPEDSTATFFDMSGHSFTSFLKAGVILTDDNEKHLVSTRQLVRVARNFETSMDEMRLDYESRIRRLIDERLTEELKAEIGQRDRSDSGEQRDLHSRYCEFAECGVDGVRWLLDVAKEGSIDEAQVLKRIGTSVDEVLIFAKLYAAKMIQVEGGNVVLSEEGMDFVRGLELNI